MSKKAPKKMNQPSWSQKITLQNEHPLHLDQACASCTNETDGPTVVQTIPSQQTESSMSCVCKDTACLTWNAGMYLTSFLLCLARLCVSSAAFGTGPPSGVHAGYLPHRSNHQLQFLLASGLTSARQRQRHRRVTMSMAVGKLKNL